MSDRSNFYWGDMAKDYEAKRSESSIWKKEDDVLAELLGRTPATVGSRVLDMPVGTGRFLELFESLGCVPVGLDISSDMILQAKARSSSRATFAVADARQLPVREESIDVAVCVRFAHLVDRRLLTKTLSEFGRVLKKNGFLIIGARLHSFGSVDKRWRRWASAYARLIRALRFRLGRTDSRSHSEKWLTRCLREVGLRMVERREVTVYGDDSYYSILVLLPAMQRNRESSSIELFGLPGAGKTTIARSTLRSSTSGPIDGYSAVDRHLGFWQCLWKHPLITGRLMARLVPVVGQLRNTAAKRVVISALRQKITDAEANGTVVHEEGASHEVWRQLMMHEALSDAFISRVLPVADVIVFVEAPISRLLERLASKPSPGPISRGLMSASPDGPMWELATFAYDRIRRIILSGSSNNYTIANGWESESSAVEELEHIINDLESRFT